MAENLPKEYYLENSSPGNLINTNPPVYFAQNQETYFPDNFDILREGSIYRANNPISNQFHRTSYTYAPTRKLVMETSNLK